MHDSNGLLLTILLARTAGERERERDRDRDRDRVSGMVKSEFERRCGCTSEARVDIGDNNDGRNAIGSNGSVGGMCTSSRGISRLGGGGIAVAVVATADDESGELNEERRRRGERRIAAAVGVDVEASLWPGTGD